MASSAASHFAGLATFARAPIHSDLEDATIFSALANSLERSEASYPVLRRHRAALSCAYGRIFSAMASRPEWRAWAVNPSTILLHAEDAFGSFRVTGDDRSCTVSIRVWAKNEVAAEQFEAAYHSEVALHRVAPELMFSLNWRFMTAQGMKQAMTIERVPEELLREAYPTLTGGVHTFIHEYLQSPASVLVLQGSPGLGKTRLVRGILKELSKRKTGEEEHADALYSGDKAVWQSDEIFVEYLTGDHDVFLIEDADHLLEPRSEGNQVLHRFLQISDGIVQAQGRKIIFSTNVPNVGDIDEALVRPGRCFAHIQLRLLGLSEAGRLLERLLERDVVRLNSGMEALEAMGKKSWSVAEVYEVWRTTVCSLVIAVLPG